jgi:hypothetical protein
MSKNTRTVGHILIGETDLISLSARDDRGSSSLAANNTTAHRAHNCQKRW